MLVGSFVTISLRHNNLIKCHHSLLVLFYTLTKDLLGLHRNCSSSRGGHEKFAFLGRFRRGGKISVSEEK